VAGLSLPRFTSGGSIPPSPGSDAHGRAWTSLSGRVGMWVGFSSPLWGEFQAISKSTDDRFGINGGKHQAAYLTDLLLPT